MRVSVFCSSAPNIPVTSLDLAFEIGKAIGEQGWDLVWGGGKASMMGQVAIGARSVGAKTIGVIPEPLINLEFEDKEATHMHVVSDMRTRKAKIEELSDAFIALPGGRLHRAPRASRRPGYGTAHPYRSAHPVRGRTGQRDGAWRCCLGRRSHVSCQQ